MLTPNGRIKAVGTDEQIKALCNKDTRQFEMEGRLITPGLVDAYCHMLSLGHTLSMVNLRDVTSLKECLDIISHAAQNTPPGQWILGQNWNQNIWEEKREPNRHDLDKIAVGHPILMTRICTHCIWVNSKALGIAGLTPDTPDPSGGKIEREDGTRIPSGIIKEAAQIIEAHIPVKDRGACKKAFLRSQRLFRTYAGALSGYRRKLRHCLSDPGSNDRNDHGFIPPGQKCGRPCLWGEKRYKTTYAWKSIQSAGIKMIFGSDAPIEPVDPLMGIQVAMTMVNGNIVFQTD